jgi:hypothetical protein
MGVGGQRHAPAAFFKERRAMYCTGEWVDAGADLNGCEPSRPPLGFNPQTVELAASRYTDYANPAYLLQGSEVKETVEMSLKMYFYSVKDLFLFSFYLKLTFLTTVYCHICY